MKQNLKPLLIVAATALSVGAGLLYASSQKNAPQSANAQAAKIGTEGFVPSAHPGVMVRSVPQENPHDKTSEKTSILIKPGGERPTRALRPGARTAPVFRQGQSAKGGTAASLPESRFPSATAHKDKNGNVSVE